LEGTSALKNGKGDSRLAHLFEEEEKTTLDHKIRTEFNSSNVLLLYLAAALFWEKSPIAFSVLIKKIHKKSLLRILAKLISRRFE
jgi:hypothetical protein